MKRLASRAVFLVLTAMVTMSCGLQEIGEEGSDSLQGGIWGGPVEGNGGESGLEQICYMTALDYQKGYDWRSDQAHGTVKCSLVVYADGRLIMKIPVGDEYEAAADPDMHRIIDGHLYTDYSTSDETVIKKDGVQIFRYPGRESICGMAVSGEDVYTLGQNRGGAGFSFRRNGEVVVARDEGSVMGTLRQENDSVSFAFSERIKSSEGEMERYYAVRNGKVRQIAVRDDIRKVWDIMCTDEQELYVASLVGVSSPVLFRDGKMSAMSFPKNAVPLSVSLSGSAEDPAAELMYLSGEGIYSAFWRGGSVLVAFPKGRTISSVYNHEDGLCCSINPANSSSSGLIYRSGELYDMPEGYSCVGCNAVCMVNGILNVGLSAYDGSGPMVWKDGETEILKINGYIASISAQ